LVRFVQVSNKSDFDFISFHLVSFNIAKIFFYRLTVKPRFNINGTYFGSINNDDFNGDNGDADNGNVLLRVVVVEGETKNISVNAEGNPPQIQYLWSFPDSAASATNDFKRRVQVSISSSFYTSNFVNYNRTKIS
jgi:hypothetical protein